MRPEDTIREELQKLLDEIAFLRRSNTRMMKQLGPKGLRLGDYSRLEKELRETRIYAQETEMYREECDATIARLDAEVRRLKAKLLAAGIHDEDPRITMEDSVFTISLGSDMDTWCEACRKHLHLYCNRLTHCHCPFHEMKNEPSK